MSRKKSTEYRFDLLSVGLQAFGLVALTRAAFHTDQDSSNAVIGLTLTALFLGALLAALSWRRDVANSPVVEGRGALAGASFAFLAAVQAFLLWPDRFVNASSLLPLLCSFVAGLMAGISIASCFFANRTRCGQFNAMFVIGAAAGSSIGVTTIQNTALIAAAATGASALILALARRRWGSVFVSTISFGLTLFALTASSALGLKSLHTVTPWVVDQTEIGSVRTTLIWFSLALAIVVPMLITAAQPGPDRRDLARLHLMVLFWGMGAALLAWRALPLQVGGLIEQPIHYLEWLAAGAVIAGLASDAWPIGAIALRRSFLGGAVGAACLALSVLVAPTKESHLLGLLFLLAVSSLLLSLAIPAAARAGGLLRPTHNVWLWAVGALSAAITFQYAVALPHTQLLHIIATSIGGGSILLALLSGFEVVISRSAFLNAARWLSGAREVSGKAEIYSRVHRPNYPDSLRILKAITYAGYAPWWIVSIALRLVYRSLGSFYIMLLELVQGTQSGLLDLILGQAPKTSAERVIITGRAPVIELTPTREWRANEGAMSFGQANRTVVTIADILTFPILSLAFLVDHAARATGVAVRHITARKPKSIRRPIVADDSLETETLVLGAQPDIVPGATASPQDILDRSLGRLEHDPGWRRFLRALCRIVPGGSASQRFAPDTPRPWDDRVFRCEVIGPRGRRFDLLGRLWQSPRRRGCVITLPTLPGQVDKSLEVSIYPSVIREVLNEDPERLKKILLRAGFRAAVSDLLIGATGPRRTVCESPRRDLLEPHQDRQCELRQELPGGASRCRQPMPQDRTRGSTTPSACADCDLPEIWERCSCLKLEGTIGFFDSDGGLRRRAHMVCRLSGEAVDLANCPRKDCFSPSTITRIIAVDASRTH